MPTVTDPTLQIEFPSMLYLRKPVQSVSQIIDAMVSRIQSRLAYRKRWLNGCVGGSLRHALLEILTYLMP